MTALRLEKHHGLGNDFLIGLVDGVSVQGSGLARRLCHRKHGIGADGLILATSAGELVMMRLWNSDGSPAEVSGNGLRCLAHAIARSRGLESLDIVISTAVGPRRCSVVVSADTTPAAAVVTAEMGDVTVGTLGQTPSSEQPSSEQVAKAVADSCGVVVRRSAAADVGNPHVVLWVSDPAAVPLELAGPAVEGLFPGGVNVEFAAPAGPACSGDAGTSDDAGIEMRVWERGAGVTEACGTGAAAAAAAFRCWGRIGDAAVVRMPGGEVRVSLQPSVTLTGPSVHVATVMVENA